MEGKGKNFVSNVSETFGSFMKGNVMKKVNVLTMMMVVLVGVGSLQATPFTPDADTLFLLTGDDMHPTIPNYYYAYWGLGQTTANMGLGGSATASPNQVLGHEAGNMAMDCGYPDARALRGPDRKNFGNSAGGAAIQQWTYEAWIKIDGDAVNTQAAHNGAAYTLITTSWQEMHIFTNSTGGVGVSYYHTALDNSGGASTTLQGGDDSVWDGQWHYIAFTGDHLTGEMKMYIDGQLNGETAIPVGEKMRDMQAQNNVASIRVGQFNSNDYFPGAIDDIRLSQGIRVPEPATIGLLALGFGFLYRRRK